MAGERGLFIVFEGIDGCGKTTQMKKFVHYLYDKSKHNHVVMTRNPYRDASIRAVLREDDDPMTKAEHLAELFVSDRKEHVADLVAPNLDKGCFVVSDRYKLSTICYQAAQGMEMDELVKMHEDMCVPDITFVFDVPVEKSFERMGLEKDRNEHKFEKSKEFLEAVRLNYSKARGLLKDEKIFIIDGGKDADSVFEEIKGIFEEEFIW